MDEARTRIGRHQHLYAMLDFTVVLTGEGIHHDGHRPSHLRTYMRATDALTCPALEEGRIVLRPHETTRILIDGPRILNRFWSSTSEEET